MSTPLEPASNDPVEHGAKPVRADARRNRSRVLKAAQQVFASQGLAAPLDEIARQAGVGPGTVYRHYPTKDALFAAVAVDVFESLRDHADTLVGSRDPGQAFFTCLSHVIETGATNKAILDALSGASPQAQAASRTASAELGSVLATLLARAQGANAVRPDITADDLEPLLIGALASQAVSGSGGSSKRLIEVICDGLRPVAGNAADRHDDDQEFIEEVSASWNEEE